MSDDSWKGGTDPQAYVDSLKEPPMNYTEQQIEPVTQADRDCLADIVSSMGLLSGLTVAHIRDGGYDNDCLRLARHRTTPAPITTEQSSEIAGIERARQIFEDASEAYDRELHEPGLTGMSPELNAAHVILKALRQPQSDAIRNAVIEECAKVADSWGVGHPHIAAAIRALTQGKPDHD